MNAGATSTAPPIVALHGGPGFTHRYMARTRSGLPGAADDFGREAVYFDWPGCGLSSRHPGSEYSLSDYVSDLESVRGSLAAPSIVLLAHGWGAVPAVDYALAHPDRCAALVLVNPLRVLSADGQDVDSQQKMIDAVDGTLLPRYLTGVLPAIERALAGDVAAWRDVDSSGWWAEMWCTQFHAPPPPPDWLESVAASAWGLESYFAHKGRAFADPHSPHGRIDLAERIAAVNAPALVIGSASPANYVAAVERHARPLATRAPRGTFCELSDVGHFPFVEAPRAFRSIVAAFLAAEAA